MLSFLQKIKKLRFKKIGAKDAAIFLINRKLPALAGTRDLGEVTDLRLNRPAKSLAVDLARNNQTSSVTINKYRFVLFKSKSFLTWDNIECQGKDGKRFKQALSSVKQIEVPKKYMSILKVIL